MLVRIGRARRYQRHSSSIQMHKSELFEHSEEGSALDEKLPFTLGKIRIGDQGGESPVWVSSSRDEGNDGVSIVAKKTSASASRVPSTANMKGFGCKKLPYVPKRVIPILTVCKMGIYW